MPVAARLEHSERLQAVARALLEREELSTIELVRRSGQCAVDTAVRELRHPLNGLDIARRCATVTRADGRKRVVHFYRLSAESRRRLLLQEAERLAAEAGRV